MYRLFHYWASSRGGRAWRTRVADRVAARPRFPYAQAMTDLVARILALGCLGLLCLSSSTSAHHATAAEYDTSKTVVLRGTITKIDWANPHIHVYIDVTENQHDANWSVEFPSPGAAIVAGLSRELLMPGITLTFEGYPLKASGSNTPARLAACAKAITLSDGSHVTFVVGI